MFYSDLRQVFLRFSFLRAPFITFEGLDGCGKSTQIKLLSEKLKEQGQQHLVTREPGGSALAEEIRSLVLGPKGGLATAETRALLMTAARLDHVDKAIQPALKRGEWVLCDRFYDSTFAYQGFGEGVAPEFLRALQQSVPLKPDLTIVLRVPLEEALQRLQNRALRESNYFDTQQTSFYQRVLEGFQALLEKESKRCVPVEASGTPEEVAQRVWDVVCKRFDVR